MDDLRSEILAEVSSEVNRLAVTIIKKLTNRWTTVYEPTVCKENVILSPERVLPFYNEISDKTKEKINKLLADITDLFITKVEENYGIKCKGTDRNIDDPYKEIMAEVSNEINLLTVSTVEELKNDWIIAYESTVCEENIKVLTGHVNTFYNEIKEETKEKIKKLLADINNLKEEAANLSRQLKIDVQLQIDKTKPLFTIKYELDKNLNGLRKILEERKDDIIKLHTEENLLCDELDIGERQISIDNLDETLPSANDLILYRKYLDDLCSEKYNRVNEINRLRIEIKRLLKDLEIYETSDEDRCLLNDRVPLSLNTIEKLQKMYENHAAHMENMKIEIDNMKLKLERLWNFLDVDVKHRKKFDKYSDKYTQKAFEVYYNELERCENEKKNHVGEFIEKLRVEIYEWWELCLKSDVERKRFIHYTDKCYTEELLQLHEIEAEELEAFYEENKKIFQKYEERRKLWDQMVTLEAQAYEPSRLNNRGGKLLQEERERKAVSKKLPKIEEELRELVLEYENKTKRKFTVYGEDMIELIEKQWEKKNEEKKEKMSTARRNITTRTPLSVKNQQTLQSSARFTPSVKHFSTAPNLKRQLAERDGLFPKAKKQLLAVSPASMQQSPKFLSKSNLKSSAQKKRIVTSIKRNSSRLNNKKNRKRSRSNKKIPDIVVNDETLPTDSTSYDLFKQRVDPSTRSSGLLEVDESNTDGKTTVAAATTTTADAPRVTRSRTKVISRLPTPKKPRQNIYTRSPTIRTSKTSTSTITSSVSPMAGPNRKLVVKDVPILF